MVRVKMGGFCSGGAVARVRRVPSPSHNYRKTNGLIRPHENSEFSSKEGEIGFSYNRNGNRVMVVVDSSAEAKGALQWALSHTVQPEDTVVLLHVTNKPIKSGGNSNLEKERASEVLRSMKNLCAEKRAGVNVEVVLQEGKEKGCVIVDSAKRLKASLLVLGQRKRSIMWRLRMLWGRNRSRARIVDYCIQNANCMTIAVRRKSKKYGGYLITTKRHKKFWLLA